MAKRFLTPTEQEKIFRAYSMNFEGEFHRMSPYCFGTQYGYTINMCPELNEKGKETGRILVNHYSTDGIPKFVDIWEREGKELHFKYRNLNSAPVGSVEDENEALKAQIEAFKRLEMYRSAISGKLQGKKLREYCETVTEQRDSFMDMYNKFVLRMQAYKREKDEYFHQSDECLRLSLERDELAKGKKKAEKEIARLKESLRRTTEELLKVSKDPDRPVSTELIHNARGAGRKKISKEKVEEMRNRILKMKEDGMTNSEIMKKLGIGKTTLYRYYNSDSADN